MKIRITAFFVSAMTAFFFAVLLIGFSSNASAKFITSSHSWTDNFDSSTLDSRWSWINEDDTHWSLTDRPGFMRITTQDGSMWGASAFPQPNILVTDAPTGDFRILTKVMVTPTQIFQQGGLIVYQDADNYIKLNRMVGTNGDRVEILREIGATPVATHVLESATTLYLQLQRQDDTYSGYFSTDGNDWIPVGQYTETLTNPKVGVSASNEINSLPEIDTDFDYFQLIDDSMQFVYLPVVIRD